MVRFRVVISGLVQRRALTTAVSILFVVTIVSVGPSGGPSDPGTSDKAYHVLAYFLAILPLAATSSISLFWTATAFVTWGALIEFVQPVFGRSGNIMDAAANALGVFLGVCVCYAFRQLKNRYDHS